MNLSDYASSLYAVATDFRNLSRINPVEIVVEYGGRKFTILVSMVEPDTITVPFNVLWLVADPEHEDFLTFMRRVDAEKYDDKGYRGSWSVIATYEELFAEEQYFKYDPEPILGEVGEFRPAVASDVRLGGFRITGEEQEDGEFIAIGTNDARMKDLRAPTEHEHEDFPRTMLIADAGKHVKISTVNHPKIGDILAVTGTDEDGNYIGEWVDPAMEFPYVGPVPQTMTIVGPAAPVRGNTGHILRANVQL